MLAFAHRCTWRSAPVRASAEALIGATGQHAEGATAMKSPVPCVKALAARITPISDHTQPAARLENIGLSARRQAAVRLHSNDRRTSPRIRLRFPLRHDSRIEDLGTSPLGEVPGPENPVGVRIMPCRGEWSDKQHATFGSFTRCNTVYRWAPRDLEIAQVVLSLAMERILGLHSALSKPPKPAEVDACLRFTEQIQGRSMDASGW